jgi:hypothetical protein
MKAVAAGERIAYNSAQLSPAREVCRCVRVESVSGIGHDLTLA